MYNTEECDLDTCMIASLSSPFGANKRGMLETALLTYMNTVLHDELVLFFWIVSLVDVTDGYYNWDPPVQQFYLRRWLFSHFFIGFIFQVCKPSHVAHSLIFYELNRKRKTNQCLDGFAIHSIIIIFQRVCTHS